MKLPSFYQTNFEGKNFIPQHFNLIRMRDVKKNVKMDLYYVNICKYEHEKNMTMLWCKITPKTNVEHIEGNEGSYSYLYPFGDLAQKNLQWGFYVCIK